MENIEKLFTNKKILTSEELLSNGLTYYNIQNLLEKGTLEKIKNGYFVLSEDFIDDSVIISELFSDGVVCMYTALFNYGYSDRTPIEWNIAINKDTYKSRFNLAYPTVKPHYTEQKELTYGIIQRDFNGTSLNIFDRDRLICEIVKFENKIDKETYNKAIQAYVNDPNKNIANLLEYSKKRRVYKKIKERIGVWL